jgi:hypothetical protein
MPFTPPSAAVASSSAIFWSLAALTAKTCVPHTPHTPHTAHTVGIYATHTASQGRWCGQLATYLLVVVDGLLERGQRGGIDGHVGEEHVDELLAPLPQGVLDEGHLAVLLDVDLHLQLLAQGRHRERLAALLQEEMGLELVHHAAAAIFLSCVRWLSWVCGG